MDASESVFISSKSNMNINSGEELLIASEGGSVNINASDIMGINSKDLFLSGSTDVNINAGQILNATSQSDMNLKSGALDIFHQLQS
jgi:phage gp45-like